MGSSPSWGVIFEKSMVRPSSRAGVPVLKRRMSKPRSIRFWVSALAAISPWGPPFQLHSPMMMRLFRYTPQQAITARQATRPPVVVSMPVTCPFSTTMRRTSAWRRVRFSQSSTAWRMRSW